MNRIEPPAENEVAAWLKSIGQQPVVVFKTSPACGTSRRALMAFDQYLQGAGATVPVDYLVVDVLDDRELSQAIARATGVRHESPQVLLLKNGMCVWTTSHISINEPALARQIPKFLPAATDA